MKRPTYYNMARNQFSQWSQCYCGGHIVYDVTKSRLKVENCYPRKPFRHPNWIYVGMLDFETEIRSK